jgi:hypothetical protein
MNRALFPVLALLLLLLPSCKARQWGLPRVELEVDSPDGKKIAYVRNHIEFDPPNQSLWLRLESGKKVRLRKLGPDSDWCDTIVWSPDSSHAGFLVQNAHLIVADAAEGAVVFDDWFVPEPRDYPPQCIVEDLVLSEGAREATFRSRPRRARAVCAGAEARHLLG